MYFNRFFPQINAGKNASKTEVVITTSVLLIIISNK